tara:strand:+ start:929 stop:1402 length:474 start_codon:yes stop_codon:yes gene_type:complete
MIENNTTNTSFNNTRQTEMSTNVSLNSFVNRRTGKNLSTTNHNALTGSHKKISLTTSDTTNSRTIENAGLKNFVENTNNSVENKSLRIITDTIESKRFTTSPRDYFITSLRNLKGSYVRNIHGFLRELFGVIASPHSSYGAGLQRTQATNHKHGKKD